MRIPTAGYGALAAAVALACGALNAQEGEELTEAERAEVEQQTEALERRREQLEEQTEALEESNEAFAEREAQQGGGQGDGHDVEAEREELVQTAEQTMEELREQNESAAELYEQAHGYAVFDTTKGGLIVTGAGGTGVAMEKGGSDHTFMHLGQAGIGLGGGFENYRLVLLFEDEQTYEDFVSGQWDGSISAQAAAGQEGVAAEEQFIEGIRAYRLTDVGAMAQVDVSGVRFWVSEELNDGDITVAVAEPSDEAEQAAEEAQQRFEEEAEETEQVFEETEEALR